MLDLNTLLPAGTTWELSQATSINDAGQIVGYGVKGNNLVPHAYLLSPQ
jgi:probable HAF family extracellular repeat protein